MARRPRDRSPPCGRRSLSSDVLPTLGWPTKPTVVIRRRRGNARLAVLGVRLAVGRRLLRRRRRRLGGFEPWRRRRLGRTALHLGDGAPAIRRSIASSSSSSLSSSSSSSSPPPPPPSSSIADEFFLLGGAGASADARRRVAPRRLVALVALLVTVGARVRRLFRRRPNGGGGGGSCGGGGRRRRASSNSSASSASLPWGRPRLRLRRRERRRRLAVVATAAARAAAGRRRRRRTRWRSPRRRRTAARCAAESGAAAGAAARRAAAPTDGDGAALDEKVARGLGEAAQLGRPHARLETRSTFVSTMTVRTGARRRVGVQRRRDVQQRVARVGNDAEHVAALEHPPQLAPHLDVVLERRELGSVNRAWTPSSHSRKAARSRASCADASPALAGRSGIPIDGHAPASWPLARSSASGRPPSSRRAWTTASSSRTNCVRAFVAPFFDTCWMKLRAAAAEPVARRCKYPRRASMKVAGRSTPSRAPSRLRHELSFLLLAADAGAAAHHRDGECKRETRLDAHLRAPPRLRAGRARKIPASRSQRRCSASGRAGDARRAAA